MSRARYFVRGDRHEVLAWAELRDPGGKRRVEIGRFSSVGLARAACERDAELRCRRDREERGVVDVRIAPRRRKAGKGRELPAANYRPRDGAALDAALGAFAGAIEEEG